MVVVVVLYITTIYVDFWRRLDNFKPVFNREIMDWGTLNPGIPELRMRSGSMDCNPSSHSTNYRAGRKSEATNS